MTHGRLMARCCVFVAPLRLSVVVCPGLSIRPASACWICRLSALSNSAVRCSSAVLCLTEDGRCVADVSCRARACVGLLLHCLLEQPSHCIALYRKDCSTAR